jgi:hypothetical protein
MTSIMQFGILTEWENIKGEGIITRDDGKTGNVHRLCVVPTAAPWRVDNTPVLKVGDRVSFEEEIWCLNVRREDGPKDMSRRSKARAKAKLQQVKDTIGWMAEGMKEVEEQKNSKPVAKLEKDKTKGNQKQTKKKQASDNIKKTMKKTMKATKKKPASENKEK